MRQDDEELFEPVMIQHMNTSVGQPIEKADLPAKRSVALVIFGAHVTKDEAEFMMELLKKHTGLDIHDVQLIEYDPSKGTPDIIFK